MKALARLLLSAAMACPLAACHVPDTIMANGGIKLYGDVVTLHADGAPEADIAADGALTIDGKTVATTPTERDLLMQYNRSVRSVRATGLAMGKTGLKMAAKAITAAASSTSDKTDAGTATDTMQTLTLGICKASAAIKSAQDQLATQLAAFKPYASIMSAGEVADCTN